MDVVVVTLNASAPPEDGMVQKIDSQHMPTKSRAWIEAECLNFARGCLGAAKSTTSQSDDCARKIRGTIGRLPILCCSRRC